MEIFNENSRYALQEHLHLITAPVQVIWGKQDQVVWPLTATFLDCRFSDNPKPACQTPFLPIKTLVSYRQTLLFAQVVDVSGASVIADALPGCKVDLLENCGHSVAMEKPCRTARLILEFIISQQDARGGAKKSSWARVENTSASRALCLCLLQHPRLLFPHFAQNK